MNSSHGRHKGRKRGRLARKGEVQRPVTRMFGEQEIFVGGGKAVSNALKTEVYPRKGRGHEHRKRRPWCNPTCQQGRCGTRGAMGNTSRGTGYRIKVGATTPTCSERGGKENREGPNHVRAGNPWSK